MRRFSSSSLPALCAVTQRFASDAVKPVEKASKVQVLHNILVGKASFKNKALLKECNVEAVFGASWKSELAAYAKTLPAGDQKELTRQIARLSLTRYTTRELACFAGEGAANVDAAAEAENLANGVKLLQQVGPNEFAETVKAEGTRSNWSEDAINKFIASVKAAKK